MRREQYQTNRNYTKLILWRTAQNKNTVKLRVIKCEYECAREIISFNRHRSFFQSANGTKTLTHSQSAKMMKTKTNQIHHHFEMVSRESLAYALITTLITTLCVSVLCLSMNWIDSLWVIAWSQTNGKILFAMLYCQETFFSSQSKQKFLKMFGIINCRFTVLIKKNAACSLPLTTNCYRFVDVYFWALAIPIILNSAASASVSVFMVCRRDVQCLLFGP